MSIYDYKAKNIKGELVSLNTYRNKVLLIVNTASRCGFTPQYQGLEELRQKYGSQGFEILAFPCNQFGAQEPGTEAEIAQFCELNYQTTFSSFFYIYRDDVLVNLTERVSGGPYAYLSSTPEKVAYLQQLSGALRTLSHQDSLFCFDHVPAAYLMSSAQIYTRSVWTDPPDIYPVAIRERYLDWYKEQNRWPTHVLIVDQEFGQKKFHKSELGATDPVRRYFLTSPHYEVAAASAAFTLLTKR